MKARMLVCVLVIFVFGISTPYGIADDFDWPRWRGPNGDGISMETDWDQEALAGGPKILWKVDVGAGYSNVAIKGDYLYTMGNNIKGKENIVFCLNAETGEEIWRYSFKSFHEPQSSPTIDGKYVYALSANGILLCLTGKNGELRWKKDLVSEYGVVKPYYLFAGSPVIEGDLIIITANTSGIALNKKTGEKVWSSDKPPENLRLSFSTGTHYATPVMYNYGSKRYAVITSYVGVHSVEVETGKVFWLYEWETFRDIQIADPLIFDDRIFIAQYWNENGCVLLNIAGKEPKVLWKNQNMNSNISSPVMIDGYIYGVHGGPEHGSYSLLCLDVETGEVMWEEDLDMKSKSISLMAADGKLIILEGKGTLRIAEATPSSYKEISSGSVLGGEQIITKFWTQPVLYKGKIYCRNWCFDLVCIDVSK